MKITLGKQHYIENFDFDKFIEEFNVKNYQEQRGFIESFDISTNPQWLDLKRGKLGASTASKFLADSQKVSAMKRTKKYQEGTEKEKTFMLAEIPLEEKLGETCKELAYKILAVEAIFGRSLSFSGPGTSALIKYIEFFLSSVVSTMTNTSTPIPPTQ